jgi:protein tyrosine phosphatase
MADTSLTVISQTLSTWSLSSSKEPDFGTSISLSSSAEDPKTETNFSSEAKNFCEKAALSIQEMSQLLLMNEKKDIQHKIESPKISDTPKIEKKTCEVVMHSINSFGTFKGRFLPPTKKDRYNNVLVYRQHRCRLTKGKYINASPYLGSMPIIFTQGPLKNTMRAFAEMLCMYNVTRVVTLTNPIESNSEKSVDYWQTNVTSTESNFSFQVDTNSLQTIENSTNQAVTFRKISVQHGSQKRIVEHIWIQDWKDGDVIKHETLLKTCTFVRKNFSGVLAVHCSAGIGRSGVFGAVLVGMDYIDTNATFDIPSIILSLRQARAGMVQTIAQYQLIHETLSLYKSQKKE